MGTLIDTSVLIAFERGELSAEHGLPLDDEVAISVITVSELWHGVERADTPLRRAAREAFVQGILEGVPVIPIEYDVARKHAQLAAQLAQAEYRLACTTRGSRRQLWWLAPRCSHATRGISSESRA